MTFSEITEPARSARRSPTRATSTSNLVDAQQTRRIVDRLVGYTLSPLLSRKVRGGLSAGRVQSVAVRLVVEREREIEAFTAREYWTIEALLATAAGDTFAAELVRIDGEAARPRRRGHDASATPTALRDAHPVVRKIGVADARSARPAPPFTTSTLQQEASRKLGVQPQADDVDRPAPVRGRRDAGRPRRPDHLHADRLDGDGRRRDGRGARGHRASATASRSRCPRAGSTRRSRRAPRRRTSRSGRRQFRRDPDSLAGTLKPEELRLYRLIWQRALASQMAPKELETTTVELADGPYELRATSTRTLFDGFARVYTEGRDDDAAEDEDGRAAAAGARRGRRDRRPRRHARPSTSPSRRRASPRRR